MVGTVTKAKLKPNFNLNKLKMIQNFQKKIKKSVKFEICPEIKESKMWILTSKEGSIDQLYCNSMTCYRVEELWVNGRLDMILVMGRKAICWNYWKPLLKQKW